MSLTLSEPRSQWSDAGREPLQASWSPAPPPTRLLAGLTGDRQELHFLEARATEVEAALRKARTLQEAELRSLAAELEEEKRKAAAERERVASLRVRIERLDLGRQQRLRESDGVRDLGALRVELCRMQHQHEQFAQDLAARRMISQVSPRTRARMDKEYISQQFQHQDGDLTVVKEGNATNRESACDLGGWLHTPAGCVLRDLVAQREHLQRIVEVPKQAMKDGIASARHCCILRTKKNPPL